MLRRTFWLLRFGIFTSVSLRLRLNESSQPDTFLSATRTIPFDLGREVRVANVLHATQCSLKTDDVLSQRFDSLLHPSVRADAKRAFLPDQTASGNRDTNVVEHHADILSDIERTAFR